MGRSFVLRMSGRLSDVECMKWMDGRLYGEGKKIDIGKAKGRIEKGEQDGGWKEGKREKIMMKKRKKGMKKRKERKSNKRKMMMKKQREGMK